MSRNWILANLIGLIFGRSLTKLAQIYNTDKWGAHFYTPHYQRHLSKFKYKKIKLLEIGIGGYDDPRKGGESLRMWNRYFPFGTIYGVDIYSIVPSQSSFNDIAKTHGVSDEVIYKIKGMFR